jgi:hypothetical protein
MNGGATWGNPNREPGLHLTPGASIYLCLVFHLKLKLESRARVKLVLGFLVFEIEGLGTFALLHHRGILVGDHFDDRRLE